LWVVKQYDILAARASVEYWATCKYASLKKGATFEFID
jgi:hypothetical protein